MPLLFKSIFHVARPAPPTTVETSDLVGLTDLELRARLEAITARRRVIAQEHGARVQPLLERRAKLMQEVGSLDAEVAYQGLQRQDAERACDRDVLAVQTELRARVVVDRADAAVDEAVALDEHVVDRLVEQMLSGAVGRNSVIGGRPEVTEACEIFDRLEVRLRSFARQAAQTLSATGRLPEVPDDLQVFSDELRRSICAKEGLRS